MKEPGSAAATRATVAGRRRHIAKTTRKESQELSLCACWLLAACNISTFRVGLHHLCLAWVPMWFAHFPSVAEQVVCLRPIWYRHRSIDVISLSTANRSSQSSKPTHSNLFGIFSFYWPILAHRFVLALCHLTESISFQSSSYRLFQADRSLQLISTSTSM